MTSKNSPEVIRTKMTKSELVEADKLMSVPRCGVCGREGPVVAVGIFSTQVPPSRRLISGCARCRAVVKKCSDPSKAAQKVSEIMQSAQGDGL